MSPVEKYRVSIDVSIWDQNGGGQLRISEQVNIQAADFLGLAAILGEFHKVAEKIKEAHEQ